MFTDDEDDDFHDHEEDEENEEDFHIDTYPITSLDLNESTAHVEEYKYEILDSNKIVESMVSSIAEVNSVVELNPTITRILLNHVQWDKEKLYEKFYDCDHKDKLYKEAKITDTMKARQNNKCAKPSSPPPPKSSYTLLSQQHRNAIAGVGSSEEETMCEICYVDSKQLIDLGCGHAFCRNCWISYLSTKIMEDGQCGRITCAALDCEMLVDDQTVLPLLIDRNVKLRYQQLITNSYVECNKQMRWCPKAGCEHAIKVVYPEMQPVKCVCGTVFCFLCGDNWHEPVKCDLIKRWQKKCSDDSGTALWVAANTKECPKCHVTIEKNGGCNHMICKDCGQEFCWVCMGAWAQHGSSWYQCNRYDENDAKAARDAQERSRSLLQRYLFYCKRYMNHMASLKFENKLYATVKVKMQEMQQHNMSWIEVQFLKKAVDVLCQCRQTLMFTYVFAYYLEKTNQSIIFEDNQRDLEESTETLSGFLERDVTSDDIKNIKQTVQDMYRYCASRRVKLLQHVQEGYEQDWWKIVDNF